MTKCFNTRVAEAQAAVPSISASDAFELHGSGKAIFVDPRPAEAIAKTTGVIPGAVNLTLDEIECGELPNVFDDTSTQVITSCQAGPMGALAAQTFSRRGFSNVRYLAGGTQAWLDAGYATSR